MEPQRAHRLLKSSLFCAALFCVWVLAPSSSYAEGTHRILEGHVGLSLPLGASGAGLGTSIGGIAGLGGRLKGTELRIYALGMVNYSSLSIEDSTALSGSLDHSMLDLAVGGRGMIPLTPNLRVYGDMLLGITQLEREIYDPVLRSTLFRTYDFQGGIFGGAGIQYRPNLLISFGLRTELGVLLGDEGANASVSSSPNEKIIGRVNITGSITLHF